MDEQKKKRLFSAGIVVGVLLFAMLLTFMVYQMIVIKVTQNRINELNEQIRALEEERDRTQDDIDLWLKNWKIEEVAMEKGWYYPEDK